MYIEPPLNYDFTKNPDYLKVITNSNNTEDKNLLYLIEQTHKDLDYVISSKKEGIPIKDKDENIYEKSLDVKSKKFENIEDVIFYIKELSKSNYFFLYSFKDLILEYDTIPIKFEVNGLLKTKKQQIRNYIIDKLI